MIGELLTIGNVTGRVVRMKDPETVVLFDGKKNHLIRLTGIKDIQRNEEQQICTRCAKEKPISEFRQFQSERISKMCDDCRGKNANAGTIKMNEDKVKTQSDPVNHPSHYNQGGIETLDIIKMSLTKEEYKGYLKGNVLKYRERAQFKGNAEQDYAKAKFYFDELEVTK